MIALLSCIEGVLCQWMMPSVTNTQVPGLTGIHRMLGAGLLAPNPLMHACQTRLIWFCTDTHMAACLDCMLYSG
jgi:hypothetical protein